MFSFYIVYKILILGPQFILNLTIDSVYKTLAYFSYFLILFIESESKERKEGGNDERALI